MALEARKPLPPQQAAQPGTSQEDELSPRVVVRDLIQQRDHAALQDLLPELSSEEIGALLEELALADAQMLWELVPEERENEILWELSDARREELVGSREPGFEESQMNAYELVDGRLRQVTITSRGDLSGINPIWIDLINVTKTARAYIGSYFNIELPDPGDAADLEISTRFYIEDNSDIHLHSNFLLDRDEDSRSVPVAFVLHSGILFSLRGEELPVFRLQRRRARTQQGYVSDCRDLLIDLYGADVEYSADALEDTYTSLGKVGHQVLSETISDQEAAAILADIAEGEDLNGRIRGNILDTHRALNFLIWSKTLMANQIEDVKQILQNVDSLNSHTSYLFGKINFLMDATVGFININQNRRINQLTVFGVVFMPINILAGIGGMSEFSMMTQGIPWPIAYALFMVGAGMVGWITYIALKYVERRKTKARRAAAHDN